jgi:hypothetical protein
VADSVAMLEEIALSRPWLHVVVTEQRLLADIADGYDVLVLGADKWAQVLDPSFYASEDERDRAVGRLPPLAFVPRHGLPMPADCVVLEIAGDIAAVSSTAARAGQLEHFPAEVRPLLDPSATRRRSGRGS